MKNSGHSTHPSARALVALLAAKGISQAVVSPGSRNAPLTIELAASCLRCHSLVDERSAAFFALGLSRESDAPVVLTCTSGSAVLNYYPAVAEAFYSRVPLVVVSADRPSQWTDQGAGQTIRQDRVLAPHTVYSVTLREGSDPDTLWYNQREINFALNAAIAQSAPVHINIPFSEPLYGTTAQGDDAIKTIAPLPLENRLSPASQNEIQRIWQSGKKKMILVGSLRPNERLSRMLEAICRESGAVVLCENLSNLPSGPFFRHIDRDILPLTEAEALPLQPDVLVTCGGMIVSKKIKSFLRQARPACHLHVSPYAHPDTFASLTHCVRMDETDFFDFLSGVPCPQKTEYSSFWVSLDQKRTAAHREYCALAPYSDFKAWDLLSRHLPEGTHLEIANSSSIRYSQLFPLPATTTVGCNRGTSGIDGSVSTAAGAAVALAPRPVTLVSGDLSFFYDSNALWNAEIPSSMRIVVVNNGAGGIFRILEGSRKSEVLNPYLETPHNLSAEPLAAQHRIGYRAARNQSELEAALGHFWEESSRPQLLEIFTAEAPNDDVLRNYFISLQTAN